MRHNIIKNLYGLIATLLILCFCIIILNNVHKSLDPYYNLTEDKISEKAIFNIIENNYPEAYIPYTNLDYTIGNYDNISHIYQIKFAQRLPMYIYNVEETTLNSSHSFLVILNSLGLIEDIIFLNNNYFMNGNYYLSTNYVINLLQGQRATNINVDTDTEFIHTSDFIIRGVESAAKHFVYEVQTK